MKLTIAAILVLKGSEEIRKAISEKMDVTLKTVYRWVNENESNGDLTKRTVVEIIEQMAGLTETTILEREPEKVG